MSTAELQATMACSFCLKSPGQVDKMVGGPGVFICNECVGLCNLILASQPESAHEPKPAQDPSTAQEQPEQGQEPPAGFRAWHEQPDDELLTGLAKIQAVVAQADAAVHDHVDVLRSRGISWTRIGAALGVSKQAAWERFSGED